MNYWILEIASNVAWREFRGRRRGGLFLLTSVESSPPLVSPSSRSLFIPLLNTFLPPSFHNCGAISRLVASFIVDSIPPPNLPHPASLHLHNLRSFSPSLSLSAPSERAHTNIETIAHTQPVRRLIQRSLTHAGDNTQSCCDENKCWSLKYFMQHKYNTLQTKPLSLSLFFALSFS